MCLTTNKIRIKLNELFVYLGFATWLLVALTEFTSHQLLSFQQPTPAAVTTGTKSWS